MKKFLVVIVLILVLAFASGCNKQLFDLNYSFTNAYMKIGDEWKDLKIKSWTDYEDGEQIQVTLEDGTVILTNSFNCILYNGTLPIGE